jgi:hypothetical protein
MIILYILLMTLIFYEYWYIQVQSMENGPTPDTAAYIQKMEEVIFYLI